MSSSFVFGKTYKDVNHYLSSKQSSAVGDLAADWALMEELHNKRLWHQLTLKLSSFVKHDSLQRDDELIQLYYYFIQGFENKINPLALVEIVAHILPQFTDHKEAVKFLESVEGKIRGNMEAVALCKVLQGNIYIHKLMDPTTTKVIIDEVEKMLEEADGITAVHGRFYLLASSYYKEKGQHAEYYRTALRYLGCTDLTSLTKQEQYHHAVYLGLAALLGDGVYNLGELLAHPIVDALRGTDDNWLVELLEAFNVGDINKFLRMKDKWSTINDLVVNEGKLREKISLLCLMQMTFKRASNARWLTFDEISKETKLDKSEVELTVMKALAQGLLKGAIDQVSETVHMTWVQPRVLDRPQISSMVKRLEAWCREVEDMENVLQESGHDFLTL